MVHAAHVQARMEEEMDEKDDAQEKERRIIFLNIITANYCMAWY